MSTGIASIRELTRAIAGLLEAESVDWIRTTDVWLNLHLQTTGTALEPAVNYLGGRITQSDLEDSRALLVEIESKLLPAHQVSDRPPARMGF